MSGFLFVFFRSLNKKNDTEYFFSFWAGAIVQQLYLVYIYSSGRKHASRNTPILPNHICYASAVYLKRKLKFTAIFSLPLTDQFAVFTQPENTSRDERDKQHSAKLKNVRVVAPPTLLCVELRRQSQPLTFRPMPASTGLYITSDTTYFTG